jgi:molybdate transport system substrate-binding protein
MRPVAFAIVVLLAAAAVRAGTVTVSAAISLKESLEQVGRDYAAEGGDAVTFNFDASGRLAQQVKRGAPVDAFVSAGGREVDQLVKAGQADGASRRVVVGNTLVLIVPAGATGGPTSMKDLAKGTGKIAVGDPASVPAGLYAKQALASLGLTYAVAPRLVLAQNVRQVLTYVERDEVSAGLVYSTDAKQAGDKVRVVDTAGADTHDPIEYPAVTITGAAHSAEAKRFLDYLATPTARAVFVAHGFTVPKAQPATRP